jgi:hypothetical protein
MKLQIGGYTFTYIGEIQPEKDSAGQVKPHMPQSRYLNVEHLRINKNGHGPFCGFKIPNHYEQCGVYALFCDGQVMYIGECVNLTRRFNMGYGIINPRNCFVGGQETNCRINNLVFQTTQASKSLSLWFYSTAQHKKKLKTKCLRL